MADKKDLLQALNAYFQEGADAILAGQGDEIASALESIPSSGSIVDRPSYLDRFDESLKRRRTARRQLQDENKLAGGAGALTGTMLSPMSRVLSLPARMVTSAAEEVGRSDPEDALEYLKALAIGAGQGAMQYAAPGFAAEAVRMRRRSNAAHLPLILDLTQSNTAPGFQRQLEAEQKQREEKEARLRAARSSR